MNAFIPTIWSDAFLEHAKPATRLSPNDVWAPSGEDYSEAVAWALLLNVAVTRPPRITLTRTFTLTPQNFVPSVIPLCAPKELIDAIRRVASTPSAPRLYSLSDKICYGRVPLRL